MINSEQTDLGVKRIIWLTHSDPRPTVAEGHRAGTEAAYWLLCLPSYATQVHLPRAGTAHGGLGPPTGQSDGDLFSAELRLPDDPSLCQPVTNCPAHALKMF